MALSQQRGSSAAFAASRGLGVLPHLEERTRLNERLDGVCGICTMVPIKQASSFSWPLPSVTASIKPKQLFFHSFAKL